MKRHSAFIAFVCFFLISSSAFARDLKLGVSGDDVKAWQKFLVSRNFDLPINGKFGPATERATRIFQKKWNLFVDGTVGNQTIQKAKGLGFKSLSSKPNNSSLKPNTRRQNSSYNVESLAEGYKKYDNNTLLEVIGNFGESQNKLRSQKDEAIRKYGPEYDTSGYDKAITNLQVARDAARRVIDSRK